MQARTPLPAFQAVVDASTDADRPHFARLGEGMRLLSEGYRREAADQFMQVR